MKVLFLAINASIRSPRDNITYTFIEKEMVALVDREVDVFFLARNIPQNRQIRGVRYLSMDELLEPLRWRRRLMLVAFCLRHWRQLRSILRCSLSKTASIITAERAIDRAVKIYGIDIIHSHFLWPSGESGVLSAHRNGIPVVATLRGAELIDRPDLDYGSMRSAFFRAATEVAFPKIEKFTTPNEHLSELLTSKFGVPAERVIRLPNGVERIVPPDVEAPSNAVLRLIAVGRLVKLKNHMMLVEAAIQSENAGFEVLIVGEGPLKSQLRDRIISLRLKNVTLISEVSKVELYELIAGSHCLVHPSMSEGMPNVVMEALALGRPCLVSDIPVHREIIEESITGWTFDPLSPSDLRRRIDSIVGARYLLARMAKDCRKSAERFSLDLKIDGYLDIYNELLGKQLAA